MSVSVQFDGKDKGLEAATRRQAAAAKDVERDFKAAAREMTQLEQAIRKGFAEATPLAEQYNVRLAKMDQLLKKDRITQAEYNAELAKMKKALQESQGPTQAVFGSGTLSQIKSMALGVASIATAQQLVSAALQHELQLRREAAEFTKAGERGGLGELVQLALPSDTAGLSREEIERQTDANFRELINLTRQFVAEGAAPDLATAGKQVFAITSAGLKDQAAFFSRLSSSGLFSETAPLVDAISQLRTQLGDDEVGDAEAIVSKALGASTKAPALAQAILAEMTKAAGAAKVLGLSDEQLFAAEAVLAKGEGGAAEGGTQLAAFTNELAKGFEVDGQQFSFVGQSLKESVSQIAALNLDYATLVEVFGRQEAVKGFITLRDNLKTYNEALANVNQAQELRSVGILARSSEGADPTLSAAQAEKAAKGRLDVTQEAVFSEGQNLIAAIRSDQARFRETGLQRGVGAFSDWFTDVRLLGSGDAVLQTELLESLQGNTTSVALLQQIVDYLARQNQLSEGVEKSVRESIAARQVPPVAVTENN